MASRATTFHGLHQSWRTHFQQPSRQNSPFAVYPLASRLASRGASKHLGDGVKESKHSALCALGKNMSLFKGLLIANINTTLVVACEFYARFFAVAIKNESTPKIALASKKLNFSHDRGWWFGVFRSSRRASPQSTTCECVDCSSHIVTRRKKREVLDLT